VKRSIATLFSLALMALAVGVTAYAAQPTDRGPACSDIIGGGSTYQKNSDGTNRKVLTQITLADPACPKQVTYTVHVLDSPTATTEIPSTSTYVVVTKFKPGDTLNITTALPNSAPDTVYVYVTTSTGTGNVSDRAPDSDFDALSACSVDVDVCPSPGGLYH
jgi:hypothetical protein